MNPSRSAWLLVTALLAATAFAQDAATKPDAAKGPDTAKAKAAAAELAKKLPGVLDDLSKKLGAVRTLRSRFEQRKWLAVFEDVVTSTGTLALAVPDKLRWEYAEPLKSVLTVDGRRARSERTSRKGVTTRRSYLLDDEPITAITVQQIFLWTRGDFAKARDGYDLLLVSEKPLVVRATPKSDRVREVVASIDLSFSDDRRTLTSVTLTESADARTVISFLDVEIDPELPEALFKIEE